MYLLLKDSRIVSLNCVKSAGWTSGRFLEMSDTGLSGKMTVLAAMLTVMEHQNDKVRRSCLLKSEVSSRHSQANITSVATF